MLIEFNEFGYFCEHETATIVVRIGIIVLIPKKDCMSSGLLILAFITFMAACTNPFFFIKRPRVVTAPWCWKLPWNSEKISIS